MSKQDKNILFTNTPLEVEASYCEVIIPLALPTNYTWSIPEHLQHAAKVGIRVEVQLRNKKYAGIIRSIHQQKPAAFEPKEILNILDSSSCSRGWDRTTVLRNKVKALKAKIIKGDEII